MSLCSFTLLNDGDKHVCYYTTCQQQSLSCFCFLFGTSLSWLSTSRKLHGLPAFHYQTEKSWVRWTILLKGPSDGLGGKTPIQKVKLMKHFTHY